MKLTDENMKRIDGGGLTSAMLNAISKAINTVYELGRQTGSAIRRLISKSSCAAN